VSLVQHSVARRLQPAGGVLALVLAILSAREQGWAQNRVPRQLRGVNVAEQLGKSVGLDLPFVDQNGQAVRLADYVGGDRPVLLTLNYYRCPTLCTLQLNELIRTIRELGWRPGDRFRMLTISIDQRETPALAAKNRSAYLKALGLGDVDWSFLVGKQEHVETLAKQVGFQDQYDKTTDQFAHPAVAFFLSPGGKIARYLYGITFPARDLKFALVDASEGRVGSTIDKIVLSCFQYDSAQGSYTPFAFGVMRLGGAIVVSCLGLFLFILWRRDRRNRPNPGEPLARQPENTSR
jgi:protein SCO1/2